jgi:glycosyltransferase involved in cell wall biosynthesis
MAACRARVLFSTAILPRYRVPFHEGVRANLESFGVTYDVVYGQPTASEAAKGDLATLSWGKQVINRYCPIGGASGLWQPILSEVWGSDLVVVGQENRFLTNYVIQAQRRFRRPKIGLWGHGRNFQADAKSVAAERWKRAWATRCDWWFAYTETSRKVVETYGFPPERITVIDNAIDTSGLRRSIAQVDNRGLDSLRTQLGAESDCVGVYVGGLYRHKRLDFLIEASKDIQRRVPGFVLAVVGDGVDRNVVEAAATQHSWIRYLGPLFGDEKAKILRLGRVFMMPGLVGLAVLDCAAAGLPIVTTAYPYHSPEIAYLEPGRNGLVVADWTNPKAYADAVVGVLQGDQLHSSLAAGAKEVGKEFTVERMIQRFSGGVLAALKAPKYTNRGTRTAQAAV